MGTKRQGAHDGQPELWRSTFFFEWDGRHLRQVAGPPNAPYDGSFYGNMLVLPTGQILLTDFSTDIELYNPKISEDDREFQHSIAPQIVSAPQTVTRGGSYQIRGYLFNGVTQGAAYGDDAQAATNYPLVRITNLSTSHVCSTAGTALTAQPRALRVVQCLKPHGGAAHLAQDVDLEARALGRQRGIAGRNPPKYLRDTRSSIAGRAAVAVF